jgi:hypothetical protein
MSGSERKEGKTQKEERTAGKVNRQGCRKEEG